MKNRNRVSSGKTLMLKSFAIIFIGFAFGSFAHAQSTNFDHVYVKKDCAGSTDCFTTITSLNAWLWGQYPSNPSGPIPRCSAPSVSDPVLVDIGPGTFAQQIGIGSGLLHCPEGPPTPVDQGSNDGGPTIVRNGYVTVRGSGADQTTLQAEGQGVGMVSRFCTEITIEDLSIISDNSIGIYWYGGGNSRWTNLFVKGELAGWYDGGPPGNCSSGEKGLHYWFSSRIESPKTTYKASCDESWIYGSDLVLTVNSDTPDKSNVLRIFDEGDVRVFGSSVRVDASDLLTDVDLYGVRVGTTYNFGLDDGNGTFHMHGGIINVSAPNSNLATLTAIEVNRNAGDVQGAGLAHVVDTAFVLRSGPANTGEVRRVALTPEDSPSSALRSPFLWPAGTTPPLDDDLVSLTGYDQYVEIDCQSDGLCDETGKAVRHPHLMIYDALCGNAAPVGTGTPWFDTVTNRCRNDDGS